MPSPVTDTGAVRQIAHTLKSMCAQYGHPDWSTHEFIDALSDVADKLYAIADDLPSEKTDNPQYDERTGLLIHAAPQVSASAPPSKSLRSDGPAVAAPDKAPCSSEAAGARNADLERSESSREVTGANPVEGTNSFQFDKKKTALEYLTDIANAFDPVERPVEFEPDTWTRIRNAIYDLSARGDSKDTARLDYMERFIVEGTNLESGKVAWLADVECLRETIDEAIVQERIKTPYVKDSDGKA